jgi:hypothetical protein
MIPGILSGEFRPAIFWVPGMRITAMDSADFSLIGMKLTKVGALF